MSGIFTRQLLKVVLSIARYFSCLCSYSVLSFCYRINFGLNRITSSFVIIFRTRHWSFAQVITYADVRNDYIMEKNFTSAAKLPKLIWNANAHFKTDRIHENTAEALAWLVQRRLNSVTLKGKRYIKHGGSIRILAIYMKSVGRRLAKLQKIEIQSRI